MSTASFDLRKEAKIQALRAGFESLSDVARSLGINRSRLDDILTGRSPCSPETAEKLESALLWSELPHLLAMQAQRSQRRRRAVVASGKYPRHQDQDPAPASRMHELASVEYGRQGELEPSSIVIRYPDDLPPGVPLWAVVVIEQARSLGKRPLVEDSACPEAWALAASEIIEGVVSELRREYLRKKAIASGTTRSASSALSATTTTDAPEQPAPAPPPARVSNSPRRRITGH